MPPSDRDAPESRAMFLHGGVMHDCRDAHRTRDFISSPHLGPAPAFSKCTPDSLSVGDRPMVALKQVPCPVDLSELSIRGNLSVEERQILEQVLYELRLRFVQASADCGGGKRIIES